MHLRMVEYYKLEIVTEDNNTTLKRVKEGEGLFHQFGISYEEFESGPGQFTTAIIELQDGSIISVDAEYIKFIK